MSAAVVFARVDWAVEGVVRQVGRANPKTKRRRIKVRNSNNKI